MKKINVLVLGGGGREHAICWKLSQSNLLNNLFCIPGNAGISEIAKTSPEISLTDFKKIKDFSYSNKIDVIFVGPELPLVKGIKNFFDGSHIKVFGPSEQAAQLEGSKIFTKNFLSKYNIPTPAYNTFFSSDDALYFINNINNYPIVIKADGLAAGKGVMIASDKSEAINCIKDMMEYRKFESAGEKIVIEEFVKGRELSYEIIVDGEKYIDLKPSQDYKKVFDGDRGPNTGGMGNIAPPSWLSEELKNKIKTSIVDKLIPSIIAEGIHFTGILFVGMIVSSYEAKVLEINVRLGDPEAQVVLPLLKSDLLTTIEMVLNGEIGKLNLEWFNCYSTCVVLTSEGYPGKYEKGKEIRGLNEVSKMDKVLVFHAGTTSNDGKFYTNGGRVLNVVGIGKTKEESIERAYEGVSKIHFEGMHYRKDIGL